ncbi:uncharacterized protein LOC112524776 [Cynara cardunculus var. scolymus]|uniref:uncharacterized protein LOC112524776 n=1 Tax=Cynara cardunculus var. scolymus TaxID=59895 RepID=UPI000D62DED4|nr:uncharacterized protein LOC112524776 [Cynara cardunculus var. scolymus]
MASHTWRILTNRDSLWVKWIHSYRLKDRNFWDAPIRSDVGWGWRKILGMREKIRDFIVSQIGDGASTSTWYDNWHPAGPLYRHISSHSILNSNISLSASVRDIVFQGNWTSPLLRDNSNPSICVSPLPVLSPTTPDQLLWRTRDGRLTPFSVREVWLSLRPNEPDVSWHHLVWFSQSIPRHAFILCVALKQRLKMHDKLRFWEAHSDLSCAFCQNGPDSHSHLFFECPFPNLVWNGLKAKMNLNGVPDNWDDIISMLQQATKGKTIWSIIRRLVLVGTVYHLWHERNNRIFKSKRRSHIMVGKTITDDVRSRLLSLTFKPSPNVDRAQLAWNLP